jgi:membrane-associated protein
MPDLTHIIDSWGYVAIFVIVVLGNIGLPVPEETVLTIGGYLAWQGQLRFSLVVLVGIVSAMAGDNLGYWLGRRHGQRMLAYLMAAAPERVEKMQRFVRNHGALSFSSPGSSRVSGSWPGPSREAPVSRRGVSSSRTCSARWSTRRSS